MAERYEILQHIENPFVASQCPVLLLSHALTKDTETDSVFLQCKFENLNSKEIKAFYISVYCADVTGQALSGVDAFSYLDISVPQYQTFGGQVPVFLPDKESRVFSIIPDKIVYLDGSMWNKDSDIPFQPFSIKSQPIKSLGELSEQYYRELHTICAAYDKHNQLPLRKDGFTVCGCGNIVPETETQCPACGVSFEKIFSINDVNYLHRNLDQYKQEQSEREAQAKQAAEEKKQQDMLKKERLTKNAKKISIVGGSLVASIVVSALVIQVLIPSIRYGIAENAIASGKYEEAIATFEDLGEFKNASDKVKEAKYAWAESKLSDGDTEDAIELLNTLGNYHNATIKVQEIQNNKSYAEAEDAFINGHYEEAKHIFESLGNYSDSRDQLQKCIMKIGETHYSLAIKSLKSNDTKTALKEFLLAVPYKDSIAQAQKLGNFKQKLALGNQNIFWMKSNDQIHILNNYLDGTSTNSSGKHELASVSTWKNITQIAASGGNIIGLQTNGKFVAAGIGWATMEGWTSNWSNIVDIKLGADSLGPPRIVGLKSDGTVVANGWSGGVPITGENAGQINYNDGGGAACQVSDWRNIIAIATGSSHTIGLMSDGTVVAAGHNNNACQVSDWNNIIAIDAGSSHSIGLKNDGTIVIARSHNLDDTLDDVTEWNNIISIAAGDHHNVGLKTDGTVVATGSNNNGECNVSDWKQIVCIWAGSYYTIGLKSDGTLVTTGKNKLAQCDLSSFKLF